jgi:hypothetical protein
VHHLLFCCAGKSTLINGIVGQKLSIVTFKPQTTRHRVVGIASDKHYQMILFDTPGIMQASGLRGLRANTSSRLQLQLQQLQGTPSSLQQGGLLLASPHLIMCCCHTTQGCTRDVHSQSVRYINGSAALPMLPTLRACRNNAASWMSA